MPRTPILLLIALCLGCDPQERRGFAVCVGECPGVDPPPATAASDDSGSSGAGEGPPAAGGLAAPDEAVARCAPAAAEGARAGS